MNSRIISQSQLKSLIAYNKNTGVFIWLPRDRSHFRTDSTFNSWRSRFAWSVAGSISQKGYRTINIEGYHYKAHRLAWMYIYGEWPEQQIDHVNHIRDDNRISNLRAATNRENSINRSISSSSSSGFYGINFEKDSQKWRVRINHGGKRVHIGRFSSKDEAIKARGDAEIRYGYHPNHGSNYS